MNYFVFLPASEAKNSKDKRRSVYQSDYLDIRLKRNMSDEESEVTNVEEDEQEQQKYEENAINDDGMCVVLKQ